ncbi:glucosaminidase domain-containing protein [Sporanaerobacter acetigenes]|uniref:glucosaminidase domain-containing protein n=1 Tax=Sporanaerobacter acetigenes TaxID=165813 RepID=UPI00104CD88F|nr:glucosaminidase domain-containing protein [Sporanaerobacter acetigenes]
MKKISWSMIVLLMALWIFGGFSSEVVADSQIKLVLDEKDVTSLGMPIVENDKVLVPIESIAKKLGAKVVLNDKDNTIKIEKNGKLTILKINSHLVLYQNQEKTYDLSDIPTKRINNRVFVSLDLCRNVLGVGVEWDKDNKIVRIDSSKKEDIRPFSDVKILSVETGQTITGKTSLKISLSEDGLNNAKEIKYLLLDPQTAKGFVVARGKDLTATYNWLPDLQEKGERILVAGIYDGNGNFLAGDAILVNLDVVPEVYLTGIEEGKILDDTVSIGTDANFVASYVKYEITNLDTGKKTLSAESDPQGMYKWTPMIKENGNYSFRAIAYDSLDNSYSSETITVKIEVQQKLELGGVSEGQTIDKPVVLSTLRNFDVSETEYVLRDLNTGKEESLKKFGYGNYRWFPEPEYSGPKELLVRVKDTKERTHESEGIKVNVKGEPKILLEGVGPKQVLTKDVQLKITSNVKLDSVDYILIKSNTGQKKIIASKQSPSAICTYTPVQKDAGNWSMKAIGMYDGKKIESEEIPIRVYLGKIYGPKPIIEKDKFMGLASDLAKKSWEKTGMSAALQTAQAILETGWGQSAPVDKYSGKKSLNLFGIKGKGTAGSVTSNTWEVYNGKTFRVDASFRAYNNVGESWADHKDLLLKGDRYEPFREVMHNSTEGAWALKRAGYATDPQYALKLMKLIKLYNLQELDKIGI